MRRYRNRAQKLKGGAALELVTLFEKLVFDTYTEFEGQILEDISFKDYAILAQKTKPKTVVHEILDEIAYAYFYLNTYDDVDWISDEDDFRGFTKYMSENMTSVKLSIISTPYRTNTHSDKFVKGLKDISNSAFHQIWMRPSLLLAFNYRISEEVKLLKKSVYPFLKKNGVMKRPGSFPKWLHNIVKYRERGLCIYCGKNVANSLTPNQEYDIDHLVPLAKGGTNDATNLALSCPECNNLKRAKIIRMDDNFHWPER